MTTVASTTTTTSPPKHRILLIHAAAISTPLNGLAHFNCSRPEEHRAEALAAYESAPVVANRVHVTWIDDSALDRLGRVHAHYTFDRPHRDDIWSRANCTLASGEVVDAALSRATSQQIDIAYAQDREELREFLRSTVGESPSPSPND